MDVSMEKSFQLLKSIDNYLPICKLDMGSVEYAMDVYAGTPTNELVEIFKFSVRLIDLVNYFPSCLEDINILIDVCKEIYPLYGWKVLLVDIILLLVILVKGTLRSKTDFLFKLFCTTDSGLLSELELSFFLLRICRCFQKMRIMGKVDLTPEDARHVAWKARCNQDSTTMKPGLTDDDFYHWVLTSRENEAVVKFMELTVVLGDHLHLIASRTDALHALMLEKEKYISKYSAVGVPPIDLLYPLGTHDITRKSPYLPIVTFRGETEVCVLLRAKEENSSSHPTYLRVDKVVKVSEPFYCTPLDLTKYKTAEKDYPQFERYYTLSFYQRFNFPTGSNSTTDGHNTFNVMNLEPNCRYFLNFYSDIEIFQPIEVLTLGQTSTDINCGSQVFLSLIFFVTDANDYFIFYI